MKKIQLTKVYVNPAKGYELVDATNQSFYMDDNGIGYLTLDDNKVQSLITTFMVEGAKKPVWFKKLKEMGIVITPTTTELTVEFVDEDQFSYKQSIDGSFTTVDNSVVLTGTKGPNDFYAIVDGVIKKLFKRTVKKFVINGVKVGNEYQYLKLLGLDEPKKN